MSFYPITIAQVPGFGFSGGPEFFTNIIPLASGNEKRNAEWSVCRHKYTAPFNNVTEQAYRAIKDVFLVMRGRTHTFLHKDYGDYQATNEPFGTGDGTTTTFYLSKTSSIGSPTVLGTYVRQIDKPAAGATVYVNGVSTGATVSPLDGSVVFATAPASGAVLTWTGQFYVHVRFDMDHMPFALNDKNGGGFVTQGSIDLIEVINE